MADNIISVRNLCFSYTEEDAAKEHPVLKNLNIDIERGSFVSILGHNGSGKSTFAKLLNMILTPTSGKIYIDGRDITDPDMTEDDVFDIRRRVGMVFQNPDNQLVATIVEEDVAFGPENLGIPPDEIRKRVDDALDTVGMREYARHSPHQLSGGQKQRVAVAGIIAMLPECIVFDESTAMLDPKGRKEIMSTIKTLNKENGITVVLITHYMEEAAKADRVIVIDKGNILLDDVPKRIFSQVELLKSVGLDVPQATELMYELKKCGLDVPDDIIDEDECAQVLYDILKNKE